MGRVWCYQVFSKSNETDCKAEETEYARDTHVREHWKLNSTGGGWTWAFCWYWHGTGGAWSEGWTWGLSSIQTFGIALLLEISPAVYYIMLGWSRTMNPARVSFPFSLSFILPTAPLPHAPGLSSKNQKVVFTLRSVMGTENMAIAVPLSVGRKPESKPLIVIFVSWAGIQGTAKVDWVTEWLPAETEIKLV